MPRGEGTPEGGREQEQGTFRDRLKKIKDADPSNYFGRLGMEVAKAGKIARAQERLAKMLGSATLTLELHKRFDELVSQLEAFGARTRETTTEQGRRELEQDVDAWLARVEDFDTDYAKNLTGEQ